MSTAKLKPQRDLDNWQPRSEGRDATRIGTNERIHIAVATDKGKVRPNNEDAYLSRADLGLVAVADGVGGHQAGEIASSLACSILEASVSFALLSPDVTVDRCAEAMTMAFTTAGRGIVDKADANPKFNGMGTTLVAFLLPPGAHTGIVAHVGDSRLYHARGRECSQVTMDHTLYEELIAQGKAHKVGARLAETKNILTRALGIKRVYEIDIHRLPIKSGDRMLLCSDGLTDVVTDEEIARELTKHDQPPQVAVDRLVALALERGGPDNVTIAVATVR